MRKIRCMTARSFGQPHKRSNLVCCCCCTFQDPTSIFVYLISFITNCLKGGFLSEKSGGFLLLPTFPKNIPFYYPKLLHPVHGIDKIFNIIQYFSS